MLGVDHCGCIAAVFASFYIGFAVATTCDCVLPECVDVCVEWQRVTRSGCGVVRGSRVAVWCSGCADVNADWSIQSAGSAPNFKKVHCGRGGLAHCYYGRRCHHVWKVIRSNAAVLQWQLGQAFNFCTVCGRWLYHFSAVTVVSCVIPCSVLL